MTRDEEDAIVLEAARIIVERRSMSVEVAPGFVVEEIQTHAPRAMGGRIRQARTVKAITQDALASACGITREAVSMWESGTTVPRHHHLEAAASFLDVDASWIVFGLGEGAA